ncbi:hypothetical protein NE237_010791 [Protea cynaroides]|uniref:MATH domain-containing protein n=1 Tax=Protea cynaroides TaxID=273540 RepID=A0A9Q0L0W9_9MAGN|nr:hypothetical protein NE237_010791 [Protea cynaroides]
MQIQQWWRVDWRAQCSSSFKIPLYTYRLHRWIRNQQEDDDPQPMEVVSVGSVVEYSPSSRFKWTIENFSRLNNMTHYSGIFSVDGYKWRILIYPKGIILAVINKIHSEDTVRKGIIVQHLLFLLSAGWIK